MPREYAAMGAEVRVKIRNKGMKNSVNDERLCRMWFKNIDLIWQSGFIC